jgi:exonuclease SbcC
MHILRLAFEGIGPFVERQFIDFEELSAGGLFLLEGPTGSGKTTIVDAIVFALYGDVSGSDSSKGRIVSTLIPPGVEPYVELTVDTGRGLLRVRRVPQYDRPRKVGVGVTTVKASIQLWKLDDPDDEGVPVSTNIQEANDELARAIGLSKAQFTQTVVLPQGEFAAFLKSKPEDRRDLLQKIFGTELYERIATRLTESAVGMRKAVEKARDEVVDAAGHFCTLAWYDADEQATDPIPEQVAFDVVVDAQDFAQLPALAKTRLGVLFAEAGELELKVSAAKRMVDEATVRLGEIRDRNQAIAERDDLTRRQRELVDIAPQIQAKAALLELGQRAEPVRSALAEADNSAAELATREAVLAELAAATAPTPNADLVAELLTAAEYEEQQHQCLSDAGELGPLVAEEASIAQVDLAVASTTASLQTVANELREREDYRQELAKQVDSSVAEAQAASAAAVGLADASISEAATASVLRAAQEVERCRSELASLRWEEDRLRSLSSTAEEAFDTARRSWLSSMASTIALELIDEAPCPVCGSPDHPTPAIPVDALATRTDVDRLEKMKFEAVEQLQESREACNVMVARIEDRSLAANSLALAVAVQRHEEAAELVRRGQAARDRVDEIDRRLRELRTQQQQEAERIGPLNNQFATLTEQVRTQCDLLEQMKVRVRNGRGAHRSVAERAQALRDRAGVAARLASAHREKVAAETATGLRAAALEQALRAGGFQTAAEAREALLPGESRANLHNAIEEHARDSAVVDGALKMPRIASVGDSVASDVAPYEQVKREAEAELQGKTLAKGEFGRSISASEQAASAMSNAISFLDKVSESSLPTIRMASVLNALQGNELRISLATFVLLQRFEEVVDLANARLGTMTDGRYELRRTDSKEGRGMKLGLGLEVIDHASGDATREPQTLSGGETFKASLAMALGLADAVTAEAGGVELNTLFVDEGFGSLDPDSLDSVMDQLTKLRQGGRSVGVISHVAEMKQRIAERVSVRPVGDGTSRLVVVASTVALTSQ